MNASRPLVLAALISLTACSGGGGGLASAPPPAGGGGQTTQSQYVTPSFTFELPVGKSTTSSTRSPQFVGASALGVTITLVSSSVGLTNVGVTSALSGTNCATTGTTRTCTVSGPPVPPGTDTFSVVTYDTTPTGAPLAEPGGAHALAQTGSTATSPATANPSFSIVAGTSPALTITLFGIPGKFAFGAISPNGTPGQATGGGVAAPSLSLQVQDFAGDPISGTFSVPVTLTDNDTSGAQGTTINVSGGTSGLTQTFNAPNDATGDITGVSLSYGGLAIASPTLTLAAATAPTTPTASQTYAINKATLTLSPTELDLFNPTTGTGNSGTFTASETGWSNAPYSRTFTATAGTCTSGTAATVYSLGATTGTSFTDTVPATPAAGVCTVTIGGDLQGNTATETLTYTTGSFTVNGKGRSNR